MADNTTPPESTLLLRSIDASLKALLARGGNTARPASGEAAAAPAASTTRSSGAPAGINFPNYGRSKQKPVAGATEQDLAYYRAGCLRTLEDPEKARFHDKERTLLAAIDSELEKIGGGDGHGARRTGGGHDEPPPSDERQPPAEEDDIPW